MNNPPFCFLAFTVFSYVMIVLGNARRGMPGWGFARKLG